MTFQQVMKSYSKEWISDELQQVSSNNVQQALAKVQRGESLQPAQWLALLSPQAEPFLEQMAQTSQNLTVQRFGKTIQLYVPLYLSNECLCNCTYCGFSFVNRIQRMTLSPEQTQKEAYFLYQQGFRHILLLSGEDRRYVNAETLRQTVQEIKPWFSSISIEVQPLQTEEYQLLVQNGVDGLAVYQETYDREVYHRVHLSGKKKNYDYRLNALERAASVGMRKLGIGALLGLTDWRHEVFYLILHGMFLEKKFWRSQISLSLPRIKEATGKIDTPFPVSDRYFIQILTALRLCLPNAGLILSTRESAWFRDRVFPLGVTQMSAGSKTQIGGYSEENDSGAQFNTEDQRSPQEVADMLVSKGYEPVWKDWDVHLLSEQIDSHHQLRENW